MPPSLPAHPSADQTARAPLCIPFDLIQERWQLSKPWPTKRDFHRQLSSARGLSNAFVLSRVTLERLRQNSMLRSDILRRSNVILFSGSSLVDRSTTATDWLDVVETGWTEPQARGLAGPRGRKPSPCQGEGRGFESRLALRLESSRSHAPIAVDPGERGRRGDPGRNRHAAPDRPGPTGRAATPAERRRSRGDTSLENRGRGDARTRSGRLGGEAKSFRPYPPGTTGAPPGCISRQRLSSQLSLRIGRAELRSRSAMAVDRPHLLR